MKKNQNNQSGIIPQQTHAQQELPSGYERGVLKKFFDSHGFILPDNDGPDVFVHVNDIGRGVNTLRPNQRVIFKRGPGIKPFSIQAYDVRAEPQKIDE